MKFLFEYLTDSLSLLENPILDCIVLAIIGKIAFKTAFVWIGDLYRAEIISGYFSGHVLHWTCRFMLFGIIFCLVATSIGLYDWFNGMADYKWWILAGVIVPIIGIVGGARYILHTMWRCI